MPSRIVAVVLLTASSGLAACGGSGSPLIDAGDLTPADDAAPTCGPGATVTGSIGAAGGELDLCGARLAVAADLQTEPVEFTITQVEAPAPPPFERALAGGVFTFTASVAQLPGRVSIDVPADDAPGYLYLYRYEAPDWYGMEACRTEGVAGQDLDMLGTFAALRDTNVYPTSVDGLGEGAVDVTLDGVDRPFTLDASSRGIYQDAPDGSRAVTLYLWYTPPDEELEVLNLTFTVAADGAASVLTAAWTDLGGPSYSYLNGLTAGSSTIALTAESAGERYVGALSVTFSDAENNEHVLTADIDVTVEKYAYPPELFCWGEEL
jgi:hypothetical protein